MLFRSAADFCQALKYRGAGTLEFLYQDGQFYFIEMNTRIQVEHPVTEAIFGHDLIVAQLKIAAGEFESGQMEHQGHAVECRLVAEDEHFRASPGRITFLHWPGGPGIRIDSHLYAGYEVPHEYDSLIAKVVAWGSNRDQAMARMRQALSECRIEGIETNQYRLLRLLEDERLTQGNMHTHMLEAL